MYPDIRFHSIENGQIIEEIFFEKNCLQNLFTLLVDMDFVLLFKFVVSKK